HPDRFFTLRYEDLVSEPKASLQQVCRFLAIPFKASMLDFYKKQPQAFAKHPDKEVEKYHQSLTNPINTKKIGVLKESLPEKDIKMADAVVGEFAELSGYKRKYPKADFKTKMRVLPGILYGKGAYLFADFLDILPFWLRLKIKEAGSVLAIVYNKLTGKL
ncbi:MAG: sulfotransferase, partial [Bacteroidota bacterium]